MRSNLSRGAARAKNMVIKIAAKMVPLRQAPHRSAEIIARLEKNFIVTVVEEAALDDAVWFRLNSGWMCTMDSSGELCYASSSSAEAEKFWTSEAEARRRVAKGICQLLMKCNSLINARKIARILLAKAKHSQKMREPALDVPELTIEDVVIGLISSGGKGLNSSELFEFMRAAASKQSDPIASLVMIAEELHGFTQLRPSAWVTQGIDILNTETIVMRNNQFVMSCARNDVDAINKCINGGQEMTAMHSELKYTGLHAAADFGAINALRLLLDTGVSPNIRDARFGQTALHFAAQSGREEVVRVLLEYSADRSTPDLKGFLPRDIANEHGFIMCREMLKDPPPPIMLATITGCSSTTISMSWQKPHINRSHHAMIEEFMIVHEQIKSDAPNGGGLGSRAGTAGNNGRSSRASMGPEQDEVGEEEEEVEEETWSPSKGYPKSDGVRLMTTISMEFTVTELEPASGHSFLILSRAASGWSKPSARIIHFTMPSAPSPPSPVELLKVNKNGLYISWQPPLRDNGCRLQQYQLEMLTMDPKDWIEGSEPQGVEHRIFNHRRVETCEKNLPGLFANKKYYFRCRCKNEMGFSDWSIWTGPFVPQEGVRVLERGDLAFRLGWMGPVLNSRTVTCYEVQMCEPTGPIQSTITFRKAPGSIEEESENSSSSGYIFHTIAEVETNELIVPNLRPGIRYQFRVRPKFDDTWLDWSFAQYSDILTMTASVPDSPIDVTVSWIRSLFSGSRPGEMPSSQLRGESKFDMNSHIDYVNVVQDPNSASIYDESGCMEIRQPAVTHDSIVISWTNRQPNGSPIEECGIEMAKVKDYNHADAESSLKATGRWSDGTNSMNQTMDASELKWIDISHTGTFLGAAEFKIGILTPAWGYVFRVRQKNGCGWSDWSLASDVIYTLAAAPPSAPEAINLGPGHAVVEWGNSDEKFKYTSLDYELQLSRCEGKIDGDDSGKNEPNAEVYAEWFVPITHRCDVPDLSVMSMTKLQRQLEAETKAAIEHEHRTVDTEVNPDMSDRFDCKRVFVDKLVPATTYVARVRVNTVTGWTSWSAVSAPFRTLAAN